MSHKGRERERIVGVAVGAGILLASYFGCERKRGRNEQILLEKIRRRVTYVNVWLRDLKGLWRTNDPDEMKDFVSRWSVAKYHPRKTPNDRRRALVTGLVPEMWPITWHTTEDQSIVFTYYEDTLLWVDIGIELNDIPSLGWEKLPIRGDSGVPGVPGT